MSRFSNYQRRFRSNQLTHLLRFNIYFKVASRRRFELPVSRMKSWRPGPLDERDKRNFRGLYFEKVSYI